MKRFITLVLALTIVLSNIAFAGEPPSVSARSAIVMDVNSGRVLYEKNISQKLSMASTTKVMTAITALEYGNLDDLLKTSPKAAHVEGSSIWLEENEIIKMEDAIYGLMLNSGNDAGIAIAEHISGDTDKYAELMNGLAKKIGAYNTNFTNPHGLDNPNHYTTAYDLALITRYGLKIPKFAEIVSTKEKKIPWQNHEWNRSLKNHNKLLWQYQYCDGVKTGFTKKAGRCLVSSATKDGWQLIAVTLNDGDDWNDHKKMLDYAFNTYTPKLIFDKNQYAKTIMVKNGKRSKVSLAPENNLILPVTSGEEDIRIQYVGPDYTTAPVSKNNDCGKLEVFIGNNLVGSAALKPVEYIESLDYMKDIKKVLKNWLLIFNNENYPA